MFQLTLARTLARLEASLARLRCGRVCTSLEQLGDLTTWPELLLDRGWARFLLAAATARVTMLGLVIAAIIKYHSSVLARLNWLSLIHISEPTRLALI
eukprot:8999519-Alexandrium_andersonii.AAC.1